MLLDSSRRKRIGDPQGAPHAHLLCSPDPRHVQASSRETRSSAETRRPSTTGRKARCSGSSAYFWTGATPSPTPPHPFSPYSFFLSLLFVFLSRRNRGVGVVDCFSFSLRCSIPGETPPIHAVLRAAVQSRRPERALSLGFIVLDFGDSGSR